MGGWRRQAGRQRARGRRDSLLERQECPSRAGVTATGRGAVEVITGGQRSREVARVGAPEAKKDRVKENGEASGGGWGVKRLLVGGQWVTYVDGLPSKAPEAPWDLHVH